MSDRITAQAEVLGGPVICPSSSPLPDNVSTWKSNLAPHQGVGVTDTECWLGITTDNYSLKDHDMVS